MTESLEASTPSGRRRAPLVVLGLALAAAAPAAPQDLARRPAAPTSAAAPRSGQPLVAVFPVENLTGMDAPLRVVREALALELEARGVEVLDPAALEAFLVRHRIRYTGGLEAEEARALRAETGVESVLVSSFDLYGPDEPPAVALTARLVDTGETLAIRWMDGVELAGDASYGLLGLGLVDEPERLLERAIDRIAGAASRALLSPSRRAKRPEGPGAQRFRPRGYDGSYDPATRAHERARIAVVPFANQTIRAGAGDVVALRFLAALAGRGDVDVVEPGLLREAALQTRLIQAGGIAHAQIDVLRDLLDVDLVLTGNVLDYEDTVGTWGKPFVRTSVRLFDARSRRVVWTSLSSNRGGDGVFLFERGRVFSAPALARRMARNVVARLFEPAALPDEPARLGRGGGRADQDRIAAGSPERPQPPAANLREPGAPRPAAAPSQEMIKP